MASAPADLYADYRVRTYFCHRDERNHVELLDREGNSLMRADIPNLVSESYQYACSQVTPVWYIDNDDGQQVCSYPVQNPWDWDQHGWTHRKPDVVPGFLAKLERERQEQEQKRQEQERKEKEIQDKIEQEVQQRLQALQVQQEEKKEVAEKSSGNKQLVSHFSHDGKHDAIELKELGQSLASINCEHPLWPTLAVPFAVSLAHACRTNGSDLQSESGEHFCQFQVPRVWVWPMNPPLPHFDEVVSMLTQQINPISTQ
eukprot:TRINITY_DN1269_c0_g5_i1.p1 TRINITY_DN1269_c0_g5~~TRINITY_DN1269_c0_g5_i1.p1  ORF type:complete len:284 (-),score=62.57 TRINITY_DN1269_c0_g5_i1:235-1008(-)